MQTQQELGLSNHLFGLLGEQLFDEKMKSFGIETIKAEIGKSVAWDRKIVRVGVELKIQVKATRKLARLNFRGKTVKFAYQVPGIRECSVRTTYEESGIDFMAIYVEPQTRWFILPASEARGKRVKITRNPEGKMARALECWSHLIAQPSAVTLQSG